MLLAKARATTAAAIRAGIVNGRADGSESAMADAAAAFGRSAEACGGLAEGLAAVKAEGIRPVSSTPVPAGLTPHLLRLPDGIFNVLLGSTMRIDPEARSSMWEDLQRGRATEIDYLQGLIVEIADRHGLQVPLSRRVVALVRGAEAAGTGPPRLTPEQIRIPSTLQMEEYR